MDLEKYFGWLSVTNLTLYIVVLTAAVCIFPELPNSPVPNLGQISSKNLFEQQWQIPFFPFRPRLGSGIFLLFYIYFFLFLFGSLLEQSMGSTRYSIFIFSGMALMTLVTLFTPVTVNPRFLGIAIILACAYMAPDFEILLFFILPLKLKWAGALTAAFVAYETIGLVVATQSAWPVLVPLGGLGNLLLLFGGEVAKRSEARAKTVVRKARHQPSITTAIHTCAVCGRTENDDPALEFRYCVDCDDLEYCMDHLRDHEHR